MLYSHAPMCSTVQCSVVQCGAVQYYICKAVLWGAVLCCAVPYKCMGAFLHDSRKRLALHHGTVLPMCCPLLPLLAVNAEAVLMERNGAPGGPSTREPSAVVPGEEVGEGGGGIDAAGSKSTGGVPEGEAATEAVARERVAMTRTMSSVGVSLN